MTVINNPSVVETQTDLDIDIQFSEPRRMFMAAGANQVATCRATVVLDLSAPPSGGKNVEFRLLDAVADVMARNPSGMGALSLTTVFGLDGMDNFPTTTQISDPGPSFKSSEEFVGDFPFGISTARNRVTLTVDVRLQTMGADPDLASLLLQGVRITGFLNDRGF